jgi:PAS domain S-box-containing protein
MKKRILIVEDERLVAEDILSTLEDLGYAVTTVVSSGEEAVTAVAREKPDLVLLDIVLKGELSGIEVAEHIRSHYKIPVVYLTAYADAPTLEKAKVTEPYGYILKPFEDRELHTAIEIALYKSRAEKCIAHLNAVLRATRSVNKLIVKEKDRDSLIQGICQHLIETRGYCKAWIILLKEDGQIDAQAAAGASELIAPFMTSLKQGELPDCAMQMLTGLNILVIEDITSACQTCMLRNANQGKGAYVGRLESHGQIFGILGVALPADMINNEKEQLLFQEVRDDVGFALHSLELEGKRCQTEKALKMVQFSLDQAADAIFWIGPTAKFYYANDAACRSLGYTREELFTLTIPDIDPLFTAEKWTAHWQELTKRGSLTFESMHRRNNGTTFPVEIRTNLTSAL